MDVSLLQKVGEELKTDRWHQGYLPVYGRYLGDGPLRILDIGPSLVESQFWRRVLPKGSVVYIMHPHESVKKEAHRPDAGDPVRVVPFCGQPGNLMFLAGRVHQMREDGRLLDAIIDGRTEDQSKVTVFEQLFDVQLRPGGHYFVENVHWGWGENPRAVHAWPFTFAHYARELTKDVNLHGRRDSSAQWSGDKRKQVPEEYETGTIQGWERHVRSVAFFKSLVLVERELC